MQDFEAYQEKTKFILEENKKKLRELDDNILIHLENKIKKYGNGAEFEIPSMLCQDLLLDRFLNT